MEKNITLVLSREPVRFKTQNFATFSCRECSMVIDTDLIDDVPVIEIKINKVINGQQNTNRPS